VNNVRPDIIAALLLWDINQIGAASSS